MVFASLEDRETFCDHRRKWARRVSFAFLVFASFAFLASLWVCGSFVCLPWLLLYLVASALFVWTLAYDLSFWALLFFLVVAFCLHTPTYFTILWYGYVIDS